MSQPDHEGVSVVDSFQALSGETLINLKNGTHMYMYLGDDRNHHESAGWQQHVQDREHESVCTPALTGASFNLL
jgi:hypothetical protein